MSGKARNVADPPLATAWKQAWASIRVRFGRSFLTVAGVGLGAALFASILVLRRVELEAGALDQAGASRLAWLAGTSLLMCLVGVANSMLLAVSERYREIGTFKCIGASDGFIVKVFLFESSMIGAAGSAAGSLVGALAMAAGLWLSGYSGAFGGVLYVAGIAASAGFVLAVVAAILPAIQASKLPAVSALRMEV
jgi:ABC-type antimicrobial peptide transport system permease subunit